MKSLKGDKAETANRGFSFKKFRVRERNKAKGQGGWQGQKASIGVFVLVRLEKTTERLFQVYFRYQVLTLPYMPNYSF